MKHFELERWQADFDVNTSRLQEIVAHNPGNHGSLRPFEGAWSVAECLQHLVITTHAFLPLWTKAIAGEDRNFGSAYPFWWRWFLAGVGDPARMRSQTPAAFAPEAGLHLDDVFEPYLKQRAVAARLAKEMYIGDVGGTKISSPFASWMKYPLDFSFDLWLAHEGRHLSQAEKG